MYTIRSGSAFSGGHTTVNVVEAVAASSATGTLDLNATPYVAATENANGGGSGVSRYTASIDLNLVNPTTTLGQYSVQPFQQAGAAPVPDADTAAAGATPLTVQLGLLGQQNIQPQFQIGVTSTLGNVCQIAVWLECNGQLVPLETVDPAATATATIVQFGQTTGGTPTFTITTGNFGSPTADGRFEYTKNPPGFTADQQYAAWLTIVANGNTFSGYARPFPVFA